MQVQFDFVAKHTVHATCRVCGGDATSPVVRVVGAPSEGGILDLYRCEACLSLSYAGDDPVIGYDFNGFAENYWHHYVQSGAGIMAMLEPLLRLRPKAGQLLDVGCGFGFVPHFWQLSGLGGAVGLETSEYGRIGREKLGIDILHSYYAPLRDDLDGRFRYVFASEVLEHVLYPKEFLADISGGLSRDGILILTTPAAESVVADCDPSTLLASLSPGFHYFLTSRMGLTHLLHQAGFRYVRVEMSGCRLFAWASHRPLPELAPASDGWDDYITYLELLSDHPDHHVAGGARYRLFKDTLNTGDMNRASKAWLALCALANDHYGVDLCAGSVEADTPQGGFAVRSLKIPDFSLSPSWLGCALYFGAKYRHAKGEDASKLIPVLCRAILEMGRDLDDLAQFAQEPAYFLPHARELLAIVLAGTGSPATEQDTGGTSATIETFEGLLNAGSFRRAEHVLWRALAEAVANGSGAGSEATIWQALAQSTQLCLGADVQEICFEAATARRPQDANLQSATGLFAFSRGRYRRAYSAFRILCNTDPLNPVYWSNLAACALMLTCYRLARAQSATALSLNPLHRGARKIFARSEILLQRPAAALAALAPLTPTDDLDTLLLEHSANLANGDLEIGLFGLAELADATPNNSAISKQFHDAFFRSVNDPVLVGLISALGLLTPDADTVPVLVHHQPLNGPELCDVVLLADHGQVHLRGCLESLALYAAEWTDRVTVVGTPAKLDLADFDHLPFHIHKVADINTALGAGNARQILLLCAEAEMLPDSIPPLFRSLDSSPTAALAAAWPLAGPFSAHPMPLDRQFEEPIPDATLAAAIRAWTRGPADVPVPFVPAGCILIRRDALETIGPLATGPITGAVQDFCLRAIDSGHKVLLVLDAPVAQRDQLPAPDRASLYARHSALRVLAAESLLDRQQNVCELRLRIQEDMALTLPPLPPDAPPPARVRAKGDGSVRSRWLTSPPNNISETDEICLFVAFAPDGSLPLLTRRYLTALRNTGLKIILCMNLIDPDAPADPAIALLADHVLLRCNEGYDFAGWADLLRGHPAIWNAGLVVFANDSLIGPLEGLSSLTTRIRRSHADFIAMTDSRMYRHHIQSFLFAYKSGGLASDVIRGFWNTIEVLEDKQQIIQRYELALLDLARTQARLTVEVLFPTETILGKDRRRLIALSPTHHLWRQLLRLGFPFVKAELLRLPPPSVRGGDVSQALVEHGVDIEELCLHIEETNVNRLPLMAGAGPLHGAE